MYLGLDLGTSAVKAVIIDEALVPVCEADAPLPISRPHPGWSEQDPADWIAAADAAVKALPASARARVRAIGLSGQMHGATLLDADGRPVRPAILWNDGRSKAECAALEALVPEARAITGNKAMPGLTAPKLLWLRRHEPETFAAIAHVLLPKDYLRLWMTGDYATDYADASGTLFLDVGAERWSETVLDACGLTPKHMPTLVESCAATGRLRQDIAAGWGLDAVPVAAGAGDNAAGAAGAGVVRPGEAMLSLGTSGVVFAVTDGFRPNPDACVHAFRHAPAGVWHQTAVILSAASAVDWAGLLTGRAGAAPAVAALEASPLARPEIGRAPVFLPYLSGERTPHDDPEARGALVGLDHDTSPDAIMLAALEGVAFALAQGADAMRAGGARLDALHVTGGGARSSLWADILAAALDADLIYSSGAALGPACGAAFMARSAVTDAPLPGVDILAGAPARIVSPDPARQAAQAPRRAVFNTLYPALQPVMKGVP